MRRVLSFGLGALCTVGVAGLWLAWAFRDLLDPR